MKMLVKVILLYLWMIWIGRNDISESCGGG